MAGECGNKWRQWNRACVDNSPPDCRSSFFWWMKKKNEKRKELHIVWCWHSRVLKYSRHTLWIIPTRTRIRQHERTRNCESQLLRNIFRWQIPNCMHAEGDGKENTKATFSHQFSLSRQWDTSSNFHCYVSFIIESLATMSSARHPHLNYYYHCEANLNLFSSRDLQSWELIWVG